MIAPLLALVLTAAPAPSRVALAPLTPGAGVTEATTDSVGDAFAGELRKLPGLQLVTRREMAAVLGLERQKQLMGCSEGACMAEMAGALDVDQVITGTLSRLGESWLLQVQRVDAKKAVTVAHAEARRKGGIDALLDELPKMAHTLYPDRAGAPVAAAVPAPAPKPLPPPQAQVPYDLSKVDLAKLKVATDGKGRYVVYGAGGLDGPLFSGDAHALYAQRIIGASSEGTKSADWVFWDPRAAWGAQRQFGYRDGKPFLTCGEKTYPFQAVPEKQARRFLKKAKLYGVRWTRQGYAIARDDEGTYYYVDQALSPRDNRDFRLYVGSAGQLRAWQAQVLVHDSGGDVFGGAGGKLKLDPNKPEAIWITSAGRSPLKFLPLEDNAKFIYTGLGAYAGLELGTPCDGHL